MKEFELIWISVRMSYLNNVTLSILEIMDKTLHCLTEDLFPSSNVYDNYRRSDRPNLELRFRQEHYLCLRAVFRRMSIGKQALEE